MIQTTDTLYNCLIPLVEHCAILIPDNVVIKTFSEGQELFLNDYVATLQDGLRYYSSCWRSEKLIDKLTESMATHGVTIENIVTNNSDHITVRDLESIVIMVIRLNVVQKMRETYWTQNLYAMKRSWEHWPRQMKHCCYYVYTRFRKIIWKQLSYEGRLQQVSLMLRQNMYDTIEEESDRAMKYAAYVKETSDLFVNMFIRVHESRLKLKVHVGIHSIIKKYACTSFRDKVFDMMMEEIALVPVRQQFTDRLINCVSIYNNKGDKLLKTKFHSLFSEQIKQKYISLVHHWIDNISPGSTGLMELANTFEDFFVEFCIGDYYVDEIYQQHMLPIFLSRLRTFEPYVDLCAAFSKKQMKRLYILIRDNYKEVAYELNDAYLELMKATKQKDRQMI